LAGCMLYWAEGAKARNAVKFSNSDPRMLVLFRRFLTDALAIEIDEIVMSTSSSGRAKQKLPYGVCTSAFRVRGWCSKSMGPSRSTAASMSPPGWIDSSSRSGAS
jgi:hypothetical protein